MLPGVAHLLDHPKGRRPDRHADQTRQIAAVPAGGEVPGRRIAEEPERAGLRQPRGRDARGTGHLGRADRAGRGRPGQGRDPRRGLRPGVPGDKLPHAARLQIHGAFSPGGGQGCGVASGPARPNVIAWKQSSPAGKAGDGIRPRGRGLEPPGDATRLRLPRRVDPQPDALRPAGHQPEGAVVPGAGGPKSWADLRPERLVQRRRHRRLYGAGRAGCRRQAGLGRAVHAPLVQGGDDRPGLCHGLELPGRLGNSHSRLPRQRAERPIADAGRGQRGLFQGRFRHDPGHAVQRTFLGARLRLRPHPAARGRLLHLRRRWAWAWPRPICFWACFPRPSAFSPARRVDGNLQGGHGLLPLGHGGLPLHHAQRRVLHPHA